MHVVSQVAEVCQRFGIHYIGYPSKDRAEDRHGEIQGRQSSLQHFMVLRTSEMASRSE